ncbi:c-type cytochrome [Pseudomarimonas arenosa]|uniref:C-type cytochrome n=1 Tax=Pseudomarimonas arenosa TaxID=2774145 RepID=A0AAW3ZTZ9_9GAMM|nr:cytochrome c [Pseudomarimonas arenosa]MBD8527954.1 c-type cytochrome [Pseudomarimonas arenosa]
MKRLAVWLLRGMLVLLLLLGAVLLAGYLHYQGAAGRHYAINDPPLQLPTDSHAMARGAHLYITRGCADCHGADGGGAEVMDAGPVARVVAGNLTPKALAARGYDADRIAAAIRHGVGADGRPLFFMPAGDFHGMSDADTAALVAYLGTLPEQSRDPGRGGLRPLGWVLNMLGKFPAFPAETLDHRPRPRSAPEAKANATYGEYVIEVCRGCHGVDLRGGLQHGPNSPPSSDLSPRGLRDWRLEDFMRAMRQGLRPDGRQLDPFMPWQSLGQMSDLELRAMWAYLQTLPKD